MKKSFKTVAASMYKYDDPRKPELSLAGKNFIPEVQTDDIVKLEIKAKCVKVDKTGEKNLQSLEITEIKLIERTAGKKESSTDNEENKPETNDIDANKKNRSFRDLI
ncbi:MAG TPA: hypothetical protein PKY81_15315 [bacterium]|nr:hypothetical protein [bacterium]HPN32319.1 hypothetical protein [bacterium]